MSDRTSGVDTGWEVPDSPMYSGGGSAVDLNGWDATDSSSSLFSSVLEQGPKYRVYGLENWSHRPEVSEAALASRVTVREMPEGLPFRVTDLALELAGEAIRLLALPVQMEVRSVSVGGAGRIFMDCTAQSELDSDRLYEVENALCDYVSTVSSDARRIVTIDLHQY